MVERSKTQSGNDGQDRIAYQTRRLQQLLRRTGDAALQATGLTLAQFTVMRVIAELTPSYWLATLGRYPFGSDGFPWQGAAVLAGWTIALTVVGALGYRRAAATSKR